MMNVDHIGSSLRPDTLQPRDQVSRPPPGQAESPATTEPKTDNSLTLSQQGVDTSQDLDQARVDEIRDAIGNGQLDIDPEQIASGLLAELEG